VGLFGLFFIVYRDGNELVWGQERADLQGGKPIAGQVEVGAEGKCHVQAVVDEKSDLGAVAQLCQLLCLLKITACMA
jgi:hypothetical protein